MTKQEQIDDVNLKLGDASDILASELRDIENNIIEEVYSDYKREIIINGVDNPANTIITVISGSTSNFFNADLKFKKFGKSCHVKGFLKYDTTGTYSDQRLFQFIDTTFQPLIPLQSQFEAKSINGYGYRLKRINAEILSIQGLQPYETLYIDSIYEIEN